MIVIRDFHSPITNISLNMIMYLDIFSKYRPNNEG